MDWRKELEQGMQRNSFEHGDTGLDNFPYMSGYLQSMEQDKLMLYQWNEKTQKNERVWVAKNEI